MNTCDEKQKWTTSMCQNQDHPQLIVQITFVDGNASGEEFPGGGGRLNDGNTYALNLCGTKMMNNRAKEGGGAIFFVSNDRSGELVIKDSELADNPSGFETLPGIFVLAKEDPEIVNSSIK